MSVGWAMGWDSHRRRWRRPLGLVGARFPSEDVEKGTRIQAGRDPFVEVSGGRRLGLARRLGLFTWNGRPADRANARDVGRGRGHRRRGNETRHGLAIGFWTRLRWR